MIKEGEALELLKKLDDFSVNCVYFDPPFNTGRVFKLASNSEIGFKDVWETDNDYVNLIEPVLIELKRVMKKDASLFFHISVAEMFIPEMLCRKHFKNVQPIFWKKSRSKNNIKKKLGATIDIIFWCSENKNRKFNMVYQPLDAYYAENSYKNKDGRGFYALGHLVNGRQRKATNPDRLYPYTMGDGKFIASFGGYPGYPALHRVWQPENGWRLSKEDLLSLIEENRVHFPKGKGNLYRKIYKHESKGKPATDLWDDIHSIAQGGDSRVYPTQKPLGLLERIVEMTTDEGDLVLDPMAGAGTTGLAAKNLNREYILFDNNPDAIEIMKKRLEQA